MHYLPWYINTPQCPQCGLLSNGLICGACLQSPSYIDKPVALFRYEFPIDAMIGQFKYQQGLHLANTFGKIFIEKQTKGNTLFDRIIPMPMPQSTYKNVAFINR